MFAQEKLVPQHGNVSWGYINKFSWPVKLTLTEFGGLQCKVPKGLISKQPHIILYNSHTKKIHTMLH